MTCCRVVAWSALWYEIGKERKYHCIRQETERLRHMTVFRLAWLTTPLSSQFNRGKPKPLCDLVEIFSLFIAVHHDSSINKLQLANTDRPEATVSAEILSELQEEQPNRASTEDTLTD